MLPCLPATAATEVEVTIAKLAATVTGALLIVTLVEGLNEDATGPLQLTNWYPGFGKAVTLAEEAES